MINITKCRFYLHFINGGISIKKRITALLLGSLLLAGSMAGCSNGQSSNTSSGEGSSAAQTSSSISTATDEIGKKMQEVTKALEKDKDATSVDMNTLNNFYSTLAGSKYKICGKASSYNCETYNGYQIATVTLTNDGLKYIISLKSADDSIKDGDYLEVEGKIGSSLSSDSSNGYASFSLSNCVITARGDEVKKNVK